jgi:hypothetical protein
MAEWASEPHLVDHYGDHRRQFPGYSIEQYDSSAQETIAIGVEFTYRDRRTGINRIGYFHRESSRMTVLDLNGRIHSHFRTDEEYVFGLPRSTYTDE